MIPLDTPPGTDIVCIDAAPIIGGDGSRRIAFPIAPGEVVTLAVWIDLSEHGPGVVLREYPTLCGFNVAFSPARFRLLDLPKELTELLTRERAPRRREAEKQSEGR